MYVFVVETIDQVTQVLSVHKLCGFHTVSVWWDLPKYTHTISNQEWRRPVHMGETVILELCFFQSVDVRVGQKSWPKDGSGNWLCVEWFQTMSEKDQSKGERQSTWNYAFSICWRQSCPKDECGNWLCAGCAFITASCCVRLYYLSYTDKSCQMGNWSH